MAGITVRWCITEFGFEVALGALDFLMLADERKICLLVVKTLRMEHNQGISPSLMFSVARFALGGINFPMKASLFFHIPFNLLMAGQAFVKELFLNEGMALQAFTLVFFMKVRDLARHHPFENIQGIGYFPACQE
jgi:hypothetical protein